jgi:type IV secretory pathway VirB4 component
MTSIIPDWEASKIHYNNHELFPNHYRMLICGSSGDGKSVILQRLLLTKMLDFDIVFLNTPSIHQMEYKIMIEALNSGLTSSHIFGL